MLAAFPVKLVEEGIDWPAWISAVAAAATLVIVVATAIFAVVGLLDARRTRHAQLVLSLNDQWKSPAILASREMYWTYSSPTAIVKLVEKVHGPDEPRATEQEQEDYEALSATPNLIELIAVLRSDKAITTDLVYRMWGGDILSIWFYWENAVPTLQRLTREPDLLRGFVVLCSDIQKMFTERARERLASTAEDAESRAGAAEEPGRGSNDSSS